MFARQFVFPALVAWGILASTAAEAQSSPYVVRGIHPPAPRPFELVTLRLSWRSCEQPPGGFRIDHVSGEIRVRLERVLPVLCGVPPPGYQSTEVLLGAFPQGTYSVDVTDATGAVPPRFAPQRLTFQVAAAPGDPASSPSAPFMDFSGHWWNPGESGWGMTMTQSATKRMSVVFFVYDASGAPTWYVAPGGTWDNPYRWVATLYRASGPTWGDFRNGTFNPDNVVRTPVGQLWLTFYPSASPFETPDFESASASWLIDGISTSRMIQRMRF